MCLSSRERIEHACLFKKKVNVCLDGNGPILHEERKDKMMNESLSTSQVTLGVLQWRGTVRVKYLTQEHITQ